MHGREKWLLVQQGGHFLEKPGKALKNIDFKFLTGKPRKTAKFLKKPGKC